MSRILCILFAGQSGANRVGVYFLGRSPCGREWGSCDILINFIEQLEQAYVNGTGLTFGSKTFSAADIKARSSIPWIS